MTLDTSLPEVDALRPSLATGDDSEVAGVQRPLSPPGTLCSAVQGVTRRSRLRCEDLQIEESPKARRASPVCSPCSPSKMTVFTSSPISSRGYSPQAHNATTPRAQMHFAQVKELLDLCKSGSQLKRIVKECFDHYADGSDMMVEGEQCLDLQSFTIFVVELSSVIGMPQEIFGDPADEIIRFDFSGTGAINLKECFKFARYHVKEYAKELAPSLFDFGLPCRTMQEAGYTVMRQLGQGSFGYMQLVQNQQGELRAIKCCEKAQADARALEELKDEFGVMERYEHTHIAKTYDIFQDNELYYLVNEPYFGGDFTILTKGASELGVQMTEEWWRGLFKQCFEGIRYLHRHATMHCDIKEPNIMLKTNNYEDPEVVIIDYGLVQTYSKKRVEICGTPGYIPPETWQSRKWYPKGDVFSMGVCMLQLLGGKVPKVAAAGSLEPTKFGIFTQDCSSMRDVAEATLKRPTPLHLLPEAWTKAVALVEKLLLRNQDQRITVHRVLDDPWFTEPVSDSVHNPTAVRETSCEVVSAERISPPTPLVCEPPAWARNRAWPTMACPPHRAVFPPRYLGHVQVQAFHVPTWPVPRPVPTPRQRTPHRVPRAHKAAKSPPVPMQRAVSPGLTRRPTIVASPRHQIVRRSPTPWERSNKAGQVPLPTKPRKAVTTISATSSAQIRPKVDRRCSVPPEGGARKRSSTAPPPVLPRCATHSPQTFPRIVRTSPSPPPPAPTVRTMPAMAFKQHALKQHSRSPSVARSPERWVVTGQIIVTF
uniref:Protein kinase domain-containing protein n=1 Tax=Noctiluca scintillans TaxID=2966 RepID=A0A7S1AQD0_NOCSC